MNKSAVAKKYTSTIDVTEKTVILRRPTRIVIPVVKKVS